MALVERLMGDEGPRLTVHDFYAANQEVISGRLTIADVKAMFEMDAASKAEYDALVALAPTGSTAIALANKALYINSVHSVFILAWKRYPQYSTAAEVRTKLGI